VTPYKLLSLLLSYPDAELHALRGDIRAAAQALADHGARDAIVEFLDDTAEWDAEDAQEAYVASFDFNRRASLHLTYAYQGDRRQRGVALLKLRRLYERLGLQTRTEELPDHLPLMLELADMLEPAHARELLGEFRVAIELVHAALTDQGSPYLPLLGALSALLGPAGEDDLAEVLRLAAEGPPGEQVGLEPFAPPEVMPVPVAEAV
jgi:nitrate reductase molybdenum cofactor assembly chaperone NarJ/NarW